MRRGWKKNKSTHSSTSTASQDKVKRNTWLWWHQAHDSPSRHIKATLFLGGTSSSPSFRHESCHSLHDLPLAMANGAGWTGDHIAVWSFPGLPGINKQGRQSLFRGVEKLWAASLFTQGEWVCEHERTHRGASRAEGTLMASEALASATPVPCSSLVMLNSVSAGDMGGTVSPRLKL